MNISEAGKRGVYMFVRVCEHNESLGQLAPQFPQTRMTHIGANMPNAEFSDVGVVYYRR